MYRRTPDESSFFIKLPAIKQRTIKGGLKYSSYHLVNSVCLSIIRRVQGGKTDTSMIKDRTR